MKIVHRHWQKNIAKNICNESTVFHILNTSSTSRKQFQNVVKSMTLYSEQVQIFALKRQSWLMHI